MTPFVIVSVAISIGLADVTSAGTITGKVTSLLVKDTHHTVVYIDRIEGKTFDPPPDPGVIDQINKEFVPHVLPILKGGSVSFHNTDSFLHNIHTYQGRRTLFNVAVLGGGKPITKTFHEAGKVSVLCDVHPEMAAYILVLETPYSAVTDEEGQYKIDNVPSGSYTLKTWHETLEAVSQPVTIQSNETIELNLELE
ncbi:MAG: carboxypeptidase-like regulatory domain-containing protein [Candidatus Omnitrophica bacterium]|nr:carboxypeptidase-like regulatory domain-containing protein [Candidatus Omnitrophota bacterium]